MLQPHRPLISLVSFKDVARKAFHAIHGHITAIVSRDDHFAFDI